MRQGIKSQLGFQRLRGVSGERAEILGQRWEGRPRNRRGGSGRQGTRRRSGRSKGELRGPCNGDGLRRRLTRSRCLGPS